jgi:hypothetical protein
MSPAWRSCLLLVMDIEQFAAPTRDDPARLTLRQRLYKLAEHSLTATGSVSRQVLARRDLGDGLLVVLHPSVSARRLLHQGISELSRGLTHHNRAASPAARLRLRLAVHQGQLIQDAHGFTSQALTHAFRLVDAEMVRAALRAVRTAELVVVISDRVHQSLAGQDPGGGWQAVWLANKETTTRCWIRLPGIEPQPLLSRLLKMADPLPAHANGEDEADVVRRRELLTYSGTLTGSIGLDVLVGHGRPSMMDAIVAQRVSQRLHSVDESIPVAQIHAGLARHAAAVDWVARRAEDPQVRAGLLRALALTQAIRGFVAVYDRGDHRRATVCARAAQRRRGSLTIRWSWASCVGA